MAKQRNLSHFSFSPAKIAPSFAFVFREGTGSRKGRGKTIQFDPAQRRALDLPSPWAMELPKGAVP